MSDPFAEAQIGGGGSKVDPFTNSVDVDDPFAVGSDLWSDYIPAPTFEALEGRLVVLIPRKFDPAAKNPLEPGATRELYTVDLTVLTGGRLAYYYNEKGEPGPRGTEDQVKEWVVENVDADNPFSVPNWWVPQQGIIGRLKKVHANGQPFLGVPRIAPVRTDRQNGMTAEQVRRAVQGWINRGRTGPRPKYVWALDDPTAEQRAIAVAWWGRVRSTIAPIVPQVH